MLNRILVTGAAGFIGSNLMHFLSRCREVERIVGLDAMTYAGHRDNLSGTLDDRCGLIEGDIGDARLVEAILCEEKIDTIIHLAAESHVDRSIEDPLCFVRTNVLGTAVLLHQARQVWKGRSDVRFHHVSTDEVFGSLGGEGLFSECTPYDPSSPYSASKAGSDHLVRAWHRTYAIPVTISNCSNNYGPFQHPEKLIPHMIVSALAGKPLPVYGNGSNIRDWLHVEDHCVALWRILVAGVPGETYCIGGNAERSNLSVVQDICDALQERRPRAGSYRDLISFVTDRPGHDHRYAIDATRMQRELGWTPARTFAEGLGQTIDWYLAHSDWIDSRRAQGWPGGRQGLLRDGSR